MEDMAPGTESVHASVGPPPVYVDSQSTAGVVEGRAQTADAISRSLTVQQAPVLPTPPSQQAHLQGDRSQRKDACVASSREPGSPKQAGGRSETLADLFSEQLAVDLLLAPSSKAVAVGDESA